MPVLWDPQVRESDGMNYVHVTESMLMGSSRVWLQPLDPSVHLRGISVLPMVQKLLNPLPDLDAFPNNRLVFWPSHAQVVPSARRHTLEIERYNNHHDCSKSA